MKNVSSTIRTVQNVVTANSPVLLVVASVTGIITTGVLSAKGGYKARGIIDEARNKRLMDATDGIVFDTEVERQAAIETVPELTNQEMLKLTWLCYAAPAVTGVSAIASVVGVHAIHNKRHAALAGLYAVTSTKLDDYREQAEELLGSKKTQQLNDVLGQKATDENPIVNNEVIILDEGFELMHDETSGRWFRGSLAKVETSVAEINTQLAQLGEAALNEFYDKLGLPPIPMGTRLGWKGGDKLDLRVGAVNTPDGRSAVNISFRTEPKDSLGFN